MGEGSGVFAPTGVDKPLVTKGFRCSYMDLLVYARQKIRTEYGTVKKFCESPLCKGIFPDLPASTIVNYLSLPANGDKKVKSIDFMRLLFKNWGITLKQRRIVTVKIEIEASEMLV